MAGNPQLRNSVFDQETMEQAKALLQSPDRQPSGEVREDIRWSGQRVSEFLCQSLETKLEKNPLWLECHPILLGSWARKELCLKSDLDVLFLGPEDKVKAFVQSCFEQGIKLRSRIPADMKDWTVNVETADVLSLFHGRSLTPLASQALQEQKEKIFSDKKLVAKLLQDTFLDRKQRAQRYDSIASFLEPHLKHGAGGLRDIYQGKVFRQIFAGKFLDTDYELHVLEYYLGFFLTLRHRLHFDGQGDILVGPEQKSISDWFQFESHKEFMRQVQRGIARVNFYSDWILEKSKATPAKLKALSRLKLTTPEKLSAALEKDQSVLTQYEVRRQLDPVFDPPKKVSPKVRGKLLAKVLDVEASDPYIRAVFRSRLIDKIAPRITRLVGYVQHDQYHRFTADAHILQACREMKRLYKKNKELSHLTKFGKMLKKKDWEILSWSAFYHDLAKGIESEDHSELGEKWVIEDFKKFALPNTMAKEVAWIVRNHLELSQAAFRKNPFARETWQYLYDLGLDKERLLRLAIFTVADIRATNPEAWNTWKSKLLAQLVQVLLDGKTRNYLEAFKKHSSVVKSEWLEVLDQELFSSHASKILLEDLKQISKKKQAGVKVIKDKDKRLWVRFYDPEDRTGILLELVQKLFAAGFQCQHAMIHTLPGLGVYDWFQISGGKTPQAVEKILSLQKAGATVVVKTPEFQSISLVSESDNEWVISFKALDQRGLLLTAVRSLTTQQAEIISARVHTWGRQVDDLFAIKPLKIKPQEFIARIEKDLAL